jgi:hypothetical protein
MNRGGARLGPGVALLLLASPLTHADATASGPGLDQLMSLLAQRRHGEALFSEEKYLSVLKQPLKSSGELIYDAPDHLEQRTLTPKPQSVVLDHGVLSMHVGSHVRTLRLADYPQLAPLIDSIRATLAGDLAALQRVFDVEYSGSLDQWQLHLTPRDSHLGAMLLQIELRGERDAVREVQVRQRDGDRSIMHVTPRE